MIIALSRDFVCPVADFRLDDRRRPAYAARPFSRAGWPMMLDDVAAVETAGRPPTRSLDTKAAINYLIASGATAISVIETEAGCTFRIGAKLLARSVALFWIMEVDAKPAVTPERKIASKGTASDAPVA